MVLVAQQLTIRMILMKKLSTYLFLIFFSFSVPSFADDIQDFEIEGMSIGDSLLDYMSEEEIRENVVSVYPDKKFTISVYKISTKIYDMGVGITYKSNDKTYKIHGVQGRVNFENDIEGCYKKQDEIEKEISSMFDEIKKEDWGILDLHLQGSAAKGSTFKGIAFDVSNGDIITITCYYYSDDPVHILKVSMTSNELSRYLEQ
jgi:hypothetical protein